MNAKADWGRAATSHKCLTPIPITKWALIFPEKSMPVVKSFCSTLTQQAGRMGITMAMPRVY